MFLLIVCVSAENKEHKPISQQLREGKKQYDDTIFSKESPLDKNENGIERENLQTVDANEGRNRKRITIDQAVTPDSNYFDTDNFINENTKDLPILKTTDSRLFKHEVQAASGEKRPNFYENIIEHRGNWLFQNF